MSSKMEGVNTAKRARSPDMCDKESILSGLPTPFSPTFPSQSSSPTQSEDSTHDRVQETKEQPDPQAVQGIQQIVMKMKSVVHNEHASKFRTPYLTCLTAEELLRVRVDGCRLLAMLSSYIPQVSTRTIVHAMLLWNVFLDAVSTRPTPHRLHEPCLSLDNADNHVNMDRDISTLNQAAPTACLQLACKLCESFAPSFTHLIKILHHCQGSAGSSSCSPHLLFEAELSILSTLGWDVTMTTTLDQVEMLLDCHFQTDDRHDIVVTVFKAFSSPLV